MKHRCSSASDKRKYYFDRGITVCDEWNDFSTFKEWALANGYTDELTIDRIDSSAGYSPSNCRFVTRKEQAQNTRAIRATNTHGYKGLDLQGNRWVARISDGNRKVCIGRFDDKETAAAAYDFYVYANNTAHTTNGFF
jgi:hypothetical protein